MANAIQTALDQVCALHLQKAHQRMAKLDAVEANKKAQHALREQSAKLRSELEKIEQELKACNTAAEALQAAQASMKDVEELGEQSLVVQAAEVGLEVGSCRGYNPSPFGANIDTLAIQAGPNGALGLGRKHEVGETGQQDAVHLGSGSESSVVPPKSKPKNTTLGAASNTRESRADPSMPVEPEDDTKNNIKHNYLETAPTIVSDLLGREDDHIELRCGICGGICNTGSDALIKGWEGMHEHLANEHPHIISRLRKPAETAVAFVKRLCFHRFVHAYETCQMIAEHQTVEVVKPWQDRWACRICAQIWSLAAPRLKCNSCSASVCSDQGCYDRLVRDARHAGCCIALEQHGLGDFAWVDREGTAFQDADVQPWVILQ